MGLTRFASPDDVDQIIEIFRSGSNPDLQAYTILGCPGIKQFVLDNINYHIFRNQALYIVFVEGDSIEGAAEFRRDRSSIFLNHIYVRQLKRGQGIGRRLILEGLHLVRDWGQNTIELDVSVDNYNAKRWYKSLGLIVASERTWIKVPISPQETEDKLWWVTSSLAEADRIHTVYGFSQFGIKTMQNDCLIGRLGSSLFRSLDFNHLDDASLLQALYTLNPSSNLLLIDSNVKYTKQSQMIEKSQRLLGSIDKLLSRLA